MAITPPQIAGLTDWRPLARGGFATVWQARQETLDRLVAVKVDQRRLDEEAERRRFLREAGAAGRMSAHPGIVTVHDAGILPDNRPYLVMDLCPGGSLTQYLAADRRLSPERIRDIGVQIADALAATHARGVLHRDVKPANVLVDAFGHTGLADFGLAAIAGPETPPQEAFEALTPAYTAPEILRRRPAAATGDVYSLAATMYALLSGRPPRWPASGTPTLPEVLELQQQPVAPLPDVDPDLMQLLGEALELDPAERPDARTFSDRLAALPLGARPVEPVVITDADAGAGADRGATASRSEANRRGNRRAVVGVLAALVAVAVLVTVLLRGLGQPVAADPGTLAPPSTAPVSASASPSSPDSSSSPSPSPDGSSAASASPSSSTPPVPPGFRDCSEAAGQPAYCPDEPECWGGLISVLDSPAMGTRARCDRVHVQQTFVAGPLSADVRQQSQLQRESAVKDLCRKAVLRTMLPNGADRDTAWDIEVLPPQASDGDATFFRCLFSKGDREAPVSLQVG